MKLKEGKLIWLILSLLIVIGEIALTIYMLIDKTFDTTLLVVNILVILLTTSIIISFFEKKTK